MAELTLFLSGSPRLERGGEAVDLETRKAMALLAYLAVTGRAHAREALAGLLWPDFDQPRALAQLQRWGGQPLPLNASCWVRDDSTAGQPELLFVRLRGAVAAVEAACRKMTQELPGQRMDTAQAAPDWQACREQTLPFFNAPAPDLSLWRLSLPQTAPALELPYAQLIEWHGGQRWLWAPTQAAAQLRRSAAEVGGSATLFRAPDGSDTGATLRFDPLKPPLDRIHQRLKAEFDPAGIFNPGRLYPEW